MFLNRSPFLTSFEDFKDALFLKIINSGKLPCRTKFAKNAHKSVWSFIEAFQSASYLFLVDRLHRVAFVWSPSIVQKGTGD